MNKNKSLPKVLIVLFVFSFILLSFTTIAGASATLNEKEEDKRVKIAMKKIGICLEESRDGGKSYETISYRGWDEGKQEWVSNDPGKIFTDEEVKAGVHLGQWQDYKFRVAENTQGTIDEYVRVVVYKYWAKVDASGNTVKDPSLNTDYIDLDFNTVPNGSEKDGWIMDPSTVKSKECRVLYYNMPISPTSYGEDIDKEPEFATYTDNFITGFTISGDIKTKYKKTVEKKDGVTTTKYEYFYDGCTFVIEMEADAVQTHNAKEAIKSAWGVDVKIDDTHRLSLS
jgi:hypothetical protein